MKYLLIILNGVFLSMLVGLVLHGQKNTFTREEVVYNICQAARIESRISEITCGDLQDLYGIDYKCELRNSSKLTKCWVEAR